MESGHGTFIVIEGTDGSGKGTQFKLLAERLKREGYEVATFDFPQYDQPSSYFVRQYLNGNYGSAEQVGPYTASLFYALDRYEATPRLRQALQEGKIVLANRYAGSSMAHQGTKFRHAEERRGYFIWLDNLEFEMLRLPRATISLVLRVPATIAQSLVDQKQPRSYTDKKRDLHEADLEHLQKAVEVYDDICQLFPKDFSRIDCTRDEQLLSIELVHDIIWQKLEPLLPERKRTPNSAALAASAKAITANADQASRPLITISKDCPPDRQSIHFTVEKSSSLLAQKMEGGQFAAYATRAAVPSKSSGHDNNEEDADYTYYTPDYLPAKILNQYQAYLNRIFDLHAGMEQALFSYLKSVSTIPPAERDSAWRDDLGKHAFTACRSVLPAASSGRVNLCAPAAVSKDLVTALLSDPLPEAHQIAQALLTELALIAPTLSKNLKKQAGHHGSDHRLTQQLSALVQGYLPDQHATPSAAVELVEAWPHNELDLVPEILYKHNNLPFKELRKTVQKWPYSQKVKVLETYVGTSNSLHDPLGPVLERARYSFDLLCDYGLLRDLQRQCALRNIECQELTPRYGYEVPDLIEQAGLTEQFEACFDLSLQLYSLLQAANKPFEAQYVTLLGHKTPWRVTLNGQEAFQLYAVLAKLENSSPLHRLISAMHQKLCEIHPLLGEAMQRIRST